MSEPAASGIDARARLWSIAKVFISLAIVAAVATTVDFGRVWLLLRAASPGPLIIAAIVLVAQIPVVAVRWAALLDGLGAPQPVRVLHPAVWIGTVFNQVLPSAVGGDVYRAWFATQRGVPAGVAASSVVLDRLFGIVVVLAILAAAVPLVLRGDQHVVGGLAIAGGVAVVLILAMCFADRIVPDLKLPIIGALTTWARSNAKAARAIVRQPRIVGPVLAWSVVGQLGAAVALAQIGAALRLPLSAEHYFVIMPASMIAAAVPISFAGWGVREGAIVVLASQLGATQDQGFALSIVFGAMMTLCYLPGLAVWWVQARSGRSVPAGA